MRECGLLSKLGRPKLSNETAVALISAIATIAVAIIAWLTRDRRKPEPEKPGQATLPPAPLSPPPSPAQPVPSPVAGYDELTQRLLDETARLSKRVGDLETKLEASGKESAKAKDDAEKARAEAGHLRKRVTELEDNEKVLKAEIARLRGLVEKPGTGPLVAR